MFVGITRKLGYILILLTVFTTVAFPATTGKIRGTVTDAITDDPLPYANLFLVGTSIGTASDFEGNYSLKQIPPGTYTLRISYVGYKQAEVSIEVIKDRTIEYNFQLETESVLGDTLIVTAQATGQKHAINQQLSSIAITNVVSSARIQELPDANAAESVSRLPGVSVIRTGGEGSRVVVRGLSPQYNRVTIDGVELPSNFTSNDPNDHKTEFGSKDQLSLSGDRATDLSMISSNMLGGIEVIKAITPDMDASALGGVINFSMRKAIKNSLNVPRFDVLSQGSYNSLKNGYDDYKLVGSYEQRFLDNSLGIFLQASMENKNLSANELDGEYKYEGSLYATDEGDPEFKSMSIHDVSRDRDRYGATLVVDYQYENGSIGFMNFFSRSDTKTINRGESYDVFNNDLYYSASNSKAQLDVFSNLLSIKHNFGDLGVDVKLSHSFSGSESPRSARFKFWIQNAAGFQNMYNTLKYSPLNEIASHAVDNPEIARFFEIGNIGNFSKDRTYNASLDLYTNITFSDLINSKIKLGGSFKYRKRSYDYNQISGSVYYDDGVRVTEAILEAYPQFGSSITMSDLNDAGYNYGDFLDGEFKLGAAINSGLMMNILDIADKNQASGGAGGGGYKYNPLSSQLDDYNGHEERSAVYAMATVNFGQMFIVVPGVRYQNLTTVYSGYRGKKPENDKEIELNSTERSVSHGYFLPMLHVRFKPTEWLQLSFAYTNTLNYPDYSSIIPSYYIGQDYIRYNNYALKPARSENFDLVVSIFSNEIGLFSVSGFRKNIKDLIFPSKFYPSNFNDYPEIINDIDTTINYSMNTYVNSSIPIDLWGIETEWQTNFWYLPEPLNGLVLNINYTHIFSEASYPKTQKESYLDDNWIQRTITIDTLYTTRLLDQPNDVLNISLGYDYEDFSFRVSMLYKDNIFKYPDFWSQNRIHSDKYLRFDMSVKQRLPWYGLQVYLNLNNLTSEDDIDINQKTKFVTAKQQYGMSGDFGVRINL